MKRIKILDSHTGGETTRLVVDGFPDLGSGDMITRRKMLAENFDEYRQAVMLTPRGSGVYVGAILCKPVSPKASAGVIFFNKAGYLGMCGHSTAGLVASLAYLEKIKPGKHLIETPVGHIEAILHDDHSVSVCNVPAYRYKQSIKLKVPFYGDVEGDVAWGGSWFFVVSEHQHRVDSDNLSLLMDYTKNIKHTLEMEGVTGRDAQKIDHIALFADDIDADSRNFVLRASDTFDLSPSATSISAKLACLAEDGELKAGEIWRQASVIGSEFTAIYKDAGEYIIPTIRSRAYVHAESTLLIDSSDPYRWGLAW